MVTGRYSDEYLSVNSSELGLHTSACYALNQHERKIKKQLVPLQVATTNFDTEQAINGLM